MDCENCKHNEVVSVCTDLHSGNYKLNDGTTLIVSKGNILKCKLEEVKSITITDGEAVCSDFEEIDMEDLND